MDAAEIAVPDAPRADEIARVRRARDGRQAARAHEEAGLMFKAIILLTRGRGGDHRGVPPWWLEEHAPLARELPGLRRLVFNVVETEDAGIDGVAELWFDSVEDFEAAYASEIGQRVAADSLAHVGGRVRLLVDEQPQLG